MDDETAERRRPKARRAVGSGSHDAPDQPLKPWGLCRVRARLRDAGANRPCAAWRRRRFPRRRRHGHGRRFHGGGMGMGGGGFHGNGFRGNDGHFRGGCCFGGASSRSSAFIPRCLIIIRRLIILTTRRRGFIYPPPQGYYPQSYQPSRPARSVASYAVYFALNSDRLSNDARATVSMRPPLSIAKPTCRWRSWASPTVPEPRPITMRCRNGGRSA